MKRSARNVHPELQTLVCEGGLFDVAPSELDLNVGRRCKKLVSKSSGAIHQKHKYVQFITYDPDTDWIDVVTGEKGDFTILEQGDEIFTITAVQKIYDNSLAYRVVGDHDEAKFGCCAKPSEIEFV